MGKGDGGSGGVVLGRLFGSLGDGGVSSGFIGRALRFIVVKKRCMKRYRAKEILSKKAKEIDNMTRQLAWQRVVNTVGPNRASRQIVREKHRIQPARPARNRELTHRIELAERPV